MCLKPFVYITLHSTQLTRSSVSQAVPSVTALIVSVLG